MKNTLIIVVALTACGPSVARSDDPAFRARAGGLLLSGRETLVQQGIAQLHQGAFDSLFATSAILRERYPDDPAGPFIAADAYNTMMRDYRVRRFEAQFDSLIDLTIHTARKALKRRPTPENYFILGSAEGYRCLHWFRRGRWLKAINAAATSLDNLHRAVAEQPEFVDPLLGPALYQYGKSKVPGLSLFVNKRKVVLKLEKIQQEGRYVSINAAYALQIVHFEAGDFSRALLLNDHLHRRFPHNPVCLYNRALLLERLNRPSEAAPVWEKLIARIEAFAQPSNGYLAECHYHLAEIYRSLDQPEKARDELMLAGRYAGRYRAQEEMDGPYTPFEDTKTAIERAIDRERRISLK